MNEHIYTTISEILNQENNISYDCISIHDELLKMSLPYTLITLEQITPLTIGRI